MEEALRLVGIFIALGAAGGLVYLMVALGGVLVKRLENRPGSETVALRAELEELRARMDEADHTRARIAELEERLDFTERLLVQQRDASRLPAGREDR